MGVSSIALLAATYKLWKPQTVFPQIPVTEWLCHAPRWIDWLPLAGLMAGLCMLVFARNELWSYFGCYMGLASLGVSICLDQHRFQPWAYQLGLFLFIWIACPNRLHHALFRWLMISIYLYSALGKLDYEFLNSVGRHMLGAIVKLLGQNLEAIPSGLQSILIAMFSLTELAIAIGLLWPKSRYVAGWFAIALHLSLILILGPLGLNHRPSVLVWNVQFAVLAYLLFIRSITHPEASSAADSTEQRHLIDRLPNWVQWSSSMLIAIPIVMPVTERFGLWDHWPSWALYAPHSSRVRVEVSGPNISRLPADLLKWSNVPHSSEEDSLEWVNLAMDRWSLESLDTPIYPQARFQLGVARELADIVDSESSIRVIVLGCANRFTGERTSEVLLNNEQFDEAASKFWLNTRPHK